MFFYETLLARAAEGLRSKPLKRTVEWNTISGCVHSCGGSLEEAATER